MSQSLPWPIWPALWSTTSVDGDVLACLHPPFITRRTVKCSHRQGCPSSMAAVEGWFLLFEIILFPPCETVKLIDWKRGDACEDSHGEVTAKSRLSFSGKDSGPFDRIPLKDDIAMIQEPFSLAFLIYLFGVFNSRAANYVAWCEKKKKNLAAATAADFSLSNTEWCCCLFAF